MQTPRIMFLVLSAFVCLGGCAKHSTWQFALTPDAGHAKVHLDGVTMLEAGQRLQVDTQEVDLSVGKKTVVIAVDGSATIKAE